MCEPSLDHIVEHLLWRLQFLKYAPSFAVCRRLASLASSLNTGVTAQTRCPDSLLPPVSTPGKVFLLRAEQSASQRQTAPGETLPQNLDSRRQAKEDDESSEDGAPAPVKLSNGARRSLHF